MIKIEYNNVLQKIIGSEHGLDLDFEFSNYSQKMNKIISELYEIKEIQAWLSGENNKIIAEIKEYSKLVHQKFENIIIVGIGTPVLGVKAIAKTVLNQYWNTMSKEQRNNAPKINFINNIDSFKLESLFNTINFNKSLFVFISTDGTEPETMSLFMIIKKMLEDEIGENYRLHIVACTKEGSIFHRIADQEGYKHFIVPYENMGSFAVMSTCGLLATALVDINIEEMILGAYDMITMTYNPDINTNCVAQSALIHYLLRTQKQKNVSVFMSYASQFNELSEWYSQYHAEVLSKDYDKDTKLINTNFISLNFYNYNAQHALLQTLIEGENNKIIDILRIEKYDKTFNIPNLFDYTSIGYLGGKSLQDLMNAEIEAFKMILSDYERPNITYTIPEISPYYIGQFVAMSMLNILIQAFLSNINPFEKMGSENLRNYVCAQLGRYGYEETLREMQEKLERIKIQSALLE